jgi:acetyltransferase-like isoleucine patch superfamily enzyme
MERNRGRPGFAASPVVKEDEIKRRFKELLSRLLSGLLRRTAPLLESLARLHAHAALDADLHESLPASVVVHGRVSVYGSGRVRIGEHVLIYPDVHLETQGNACIELGDGLVISRGAHIVAMDGIKIGEGSLIGEYTSIRDANHNREPDQPIRDSGHSAKPITIGREVWLGRGVTVLGGVMIGDKATVGANAVVTRDIPAGATAVGIPAAPIPPKTP